MSSRELGSDSALKVGPKKLRLLEILNQILPSKETLKCSEYRVVHKSDFFLPHTLDECVRQALSDRAANVADVFREGYNVQGWRNL